MSEPIKQIDYNYIDNLFTKEVIDGKVYLMATPSDEHRLVQKNLC